MTIVIISTIISTVMFILAIGASYVAAYYKNKASQYLVALEKLLNEYKGIVQASMTLTNTIDQLEAKLNDQKAIDEGEALVEEVNQIAEDNGTGNAD